MISLNFANMMSEVIGERGLNPSDLAALKDKAAAAHKDITGRKWAELAFIDLPDQNTAPVKAAAAGIKGLDNFLLLGIGGSALGPKAILDALSPMHNITKKPRVFIYENVDPLTLSNLVSILDVSRTGVNVITKSGSTAETMASFMVFYEKMGGLKKNIVATTDPVKGFLREIVKKDGLTVLDVPPGVGGRYSVLCPVGLLLAEVIGVSSDELLRGARDMRARCQEPDMMKNPAYLYGAMLYLMDTANKRNISVLIPYADRLKAFSEWFCQLWAESLGKDGVGSTPYPSVGTTDQHSQLQLWMEGPQDRCVTFIRVKDQGRDVTIPNAFPGSGLEYLGGKTFGQLIDAEQESTELALAKVGRPNMTIQVPKVDAYYLGQLFFFFEIATAFAGSLYGINPFNQPGVEEGKDYTYGMMDRKGYEARKEAVESARQSKGKYSI